MIDRQRWMPALLLAALAGGGCSQGSSGEPARPQSTAPRGPRGARGPAASPGSPPAAAVPVEVRAVTRQSIASYIETNGVLEAENEVDVVARAAGPIVDLATEEGRHLKGGDLMARIDPREAEAQVATAEVAKREAERSFERARTSFEANLISKADYDQALAAKESAEATLLERQVQLSYTRIRAPFDGIVVERTVKLGDNVTPNQKLFRVSDFDPLLSKIQVPEKELRRLRRGQPAYLTVEAWPKERFMARVLRVSPVVDATTGTVRVTLEVDGRDQLRPGMFASVFLEVERHADALTIPKAALSLESLGDTVYVVKDDLAARRPIRLGYEEAERVEVVSGLAEGDRVIVVGQDGLSDGTPIQILEGPGAPSRVAEREPGTDATKPAR
jgi:membrane fusion protein (multidrug efflux system)